MSLEDSNLQGRKKKKKKRETQRKGCFSNSSNPSQCSAKLGIISTVRCPFLPQANLTQSRNLGEREELKTNKNKNRDFSPGPNLMSPTACLAFPCLQGASCLLPPQKGLSISTNMEEFIVPLYFFQMFLLLFSSCFESHIKHLFQPVLKPLPPPRNSRLLSLSATHDAQLWAISLLFAVTLQT